ncbi:molybdenum cofactor guanylyltransferase [Qipengyuania sp. DGS5-3]|uniref:molybdenum cofactor guanylyltransferase n=1 Tax=Qipengyuania sp. DGS5-3 TaxID=3349632 RepID=UPI0036D3CACF
MKILGAILAGGRAHRFGSDKAHALYEGKRLIDRVDAALSAQCDAVVVCGREEPGSVCIPDSPAADLGPLGGLYAALAFASNNAFTHVLSAPCDVPFLPDDLAKQLRCDGAAIVENHPVVGLWPVDSSEHLAQFLSDDGRALYGFADAVKAHKITVHPPLLNINYPDDLPPETHG